MRRDLHLDVGTRVINTKTGRLGTVAEPHYLARPDPHEICIRYDGMSPESSTCDDRHDIEYLGNGWFERAYAEQKHPARADFRLGDRVMIAHARREGTVVSEGLPRACEENDVPIEVDGEQGYVGIDYRRLYKI